MFEFRIGDRVETKTRSMSAICDALGNIGGVFVVVFGICYLVAHSLNTLFLNQHLEQQMVVAHDDNGQKFSKKAKLASCLRK
jgi:hypothetical protein